MRILYVDIDSLRPDHLGCYGYHRNTSPNIDRIASQGVRFENCYVPDAPCLPSRTALFTGRFGIHNGVINHGGDAASIFHEGAKRGWGDQVMYTCWMSSLRKAGLRTATISPFGERHSAWHWYGGFNEIYNTGKGGNESAHEVSPVAIEWMKKNASSDNWFLHLNLWDPHTPYRTPKEFGNPFANDPLPAWLTEEVRQKHWSGCGPHSAREVNDFKPNYERIAAFPMQPVEIDSMEKVRMMFDGYDCGVRYADEHLGKVLKVLEEAGVMDDTMIIISSDHGENLGELNIYGDHQTADHITSRVPLIIRYPKMCKPRVNQGFHYSLDFAATTVELAGGQIPQNWDGKSFAEKLKKGEESGRDFLVVSQGAWTCQRSVRFDDYLYTKSYHDGYHGFPDDMLFNVKQDPHEQNDLASSKPELVTKAKALLSDWYTDVMRTSVSGRDPMWTVLNEKGPFHTRNKLPAYLARLKETERADWAEKLAAKHPLEAKI